MMEEIQLVRFDWAIKNILRNKANFDVLEGFLTALLKKSITVLQLLESESNQNDKNDKFNRVDLLAETHEGEKIIIEIQNEREVHYLERLLYGTSKLIVENLKIGEPYKEIKKVISINILYFFLGEGVDDYVYYGKTKFRGLHSNSLLNLKRRQKETLPSISSKDIFPEYYLIEVEKFQDIIENDLDEWIWFLKHETIKSDFSSPYIKQARDKLDYLKLSAEEKKQYQRYMENLAREKDMIEGAHEEGKAEGILETAVNLKKMGMTTDMISKATGLPEKEIEKL